MIGGTSCLASGHERGELVQVQDVGAFVYRIGSSSCSLNNIPMVPKVRLPLLRRHFCDVVQGFVRAAMFLNTLVIVCIVFPIYVHHPSKLFICAFWK